MTRLVERFCWAVDRIAGTLIALVTVLVAASAFGRYLLAAPLPDAFDISRLLLGACIMWGFASVGYRGGHITVDIFAEMMGPRLRRWVEVFAWTVLLAFVCLLVWKMFGRVESAFRSREATFDLRLPVWPFLAVIWAGAVASVGTVAVRIWLLATGREGEERFNA